MRDQKYLRRLGQDLPQWVERGWVQRGAEPDILAHVAAQHSSNERMIIALTLMGVLLLGSGVITFFAAHWAGMSKLAKLLLLFGSMSAAYIAAGFAATRGKLPRLSQGLWLLGVILFGANIMLIAQIYNIDSHYPNGVLMWALGGLLVAYAIPAQTALAAAIALAVLWTGMESTDFNRHFHWPFLLFWLACLPLVYRHSWLRSLHLVMIALLLWSTFSYFSFMWDYARLNQLGAPLYLTQVYVLGYLALFVGSLLLEQREHTRKLAPITRHYALFAALCAFFALTFPELQHSYSWRNDGDGRQPASAAWLGITLLAAAVPAILALILRLRRKAAAAAAHQLWGRALLAALLGLMLLNLFLKSSAGGHMALAFNLLFFAALVWLVVHALHSGERTQLNFAFLFFAAWLLSRYFDTFWTLLDRSMFFIAGGLVLIAGGYFLEQQRRKFNQRIVKGAIT
jgi:uncharacterized membrane protein